MITRKTLIILLIIPILILSSCEEKEKENKSPTVEISNPKEGTSLNRGDVVPIRAVADDEDGSITEIQIYIEGEVVAADEASSLVYNWNTAEEDVGGYVLSATATDDEGKSVAKNIEVILDTPGGLNPDLEYGSLSDVDGNVYAIIEIGNQVWMAENLKVSHFADGTPISQVSDEAEWNAMTKDDQAYCWYNNLTEYSDSSGALYTWAAAMYGASGSDEIPSGIQGVCPEGWHLPSDAEWKELEMFLGMNQSEADSYDWRGSDEGGMLKEIGFSKWDLPNTGASNSSGFTAVPGGFRSPKGGFFSYGQTAGFWTTKDEEGTVNAWYRTLNFDKEQLYRQHNGMQLGLSVRCVHDAVN